MSNKFEGINESKKFYYEYLFYFFKFRLNIKLYLCVNNDIDSKIIKINTLNTCSEGFQIYIWNGKTIFKCMKLKQFTVFVCIRRLKEYYTKNM